jgi:serine phosphatase RsbU (regulator of sigma subunit)
MTRAERSSGGFEWAVRSRPHAGETVCGDAHLVASFARGFLAGVVDGLGHGGEAAIAAEAAVAVLAEDPGRPVRALVETCHKALRGTRGAVLTLASVDLASGEATWIGVGNVEALIFRGGSARARAQVLPRPGVVGYQLPPLRTATVPIAPGDVLVMASDGLRRDFIGESPAAGDLDAYAARVLADYGRDNDDALVLAVRCPGAA